MAFFPNKTASLPFLVTVPYAGPGVRLPQRIVAAWMFLVMALQPGVLGAALSEDGSASSTPSNFATPFQKPFVWRVDIGAEGSGKWLKREKFPASSDFYHAWYDEARVTPLVEVRKASPPIDLSDQPLLPPDGIPVVTLGGTPAVIPSGVCEIIGDISDSASLEPVAGAIIEAIGTGKTTETDAKGRFKITGISPGTYTLEANKLGYFTESGSVTALPGQVMELRLGLRLKPADDGSQEYTLEEETLVGEYQGEMAGSLGLNLSADTPVLSSGVNRDDFARTAVGDAGEAIAKVSGANIVDGKYAVVRGLADRYVTTTFNGAQISSADPSRKAVQLDLFPTNVIESINVAKTYSPELSADFGGAAIDIVTRAFPEKQVITFKAKVEQNSGLDDKMYVHPGHSLGFFGKAGPALPDVLETKDPATGNPLFLPTPTTTTEELKVKMTTLHLSQSLLPVLDDSEEGYSYSLTFGQTFKLPNEMKLGVMAAFAQSSGDSTNTSDINNQNRSYIKDEYERGVELSAFVSTALQINELNDVQFTYFDKHAAKDTVAQGRRITGGSQDYGNIVNYSNNTLVRDTYGADAVYFREFWDIGTVVRDLEIFQTKGSHRLSEDGAKLDWAVTNSSSSEDRPHSTHFEYGVLDFSAAVLQPYVAAANARLDQVIKENAVFFGLDPETATWANSRPVVVATLGEETAAAIETNNGLPVVNDSLPPIQTIFPVSGIIGQNERTITAFRRTDSTKEEASHSQIGITIPFHFADPADKHLFEIGIGGSHLKKTREVTARVYGLVTAETNGNFAFPNNLGGLDNSLAEDPSGLSEYFTGDVNTGPYYAYGVGDGGVENIDTILSQDGLYLSGRLQLGDFFLSGGVRQEKESYQIDVASSPLVPFTDAQIDALGWEKRDEQEALLPCVTTGTSIFDNSVDLLFGWSVTIARPTFWEFLPTTSTDQSSGIVRRGNVELDHTTINNFDLAATIRPADNITLRASVFHKYLERPLVQVFTNGGIIYRDSAVDASGQVLEYDATINGVEIEAAISKLGPFSLRGNFTYIDAILNYYFDGGGQLSPVASQLPFQPSIIANATLGYEYEPWQVSAYLTYNFNGEYPTILKSSEADSEVTRLANSTFDLVLAKTFGIDENDYTLRCGVKNLLNAEDAYDYNGKVYSNDAIGRTYFVEAELRF